MKSGIRLGGVFVAECYEKKTGRLKWKRTSHNIVTNQGIQYILDVGFTGDTYISPWYTGLMASTAITSTYDMGEISEATEVSNATRPIYVETRTVNTLSNAAAKSTFTMDKDGTTVEGAFLCSSNTLGSTAGILMSGAPFSGGTKVGDSGDKIVVTYTFVGSDDTSS